MPDCSSNTYSNCPTRERLGGCPVDLNLVVEMPNLLRNPVGHFNVVKCEVPSSEIELENELFFVRVQRKTESQTHNLPICARNLEA